MKKRYIVLLVFTLLVAGLLTWRLWPQSLVSILPDDAYSFTSVSASAMADIIVSGYPDFRHFRLEDKELLAAVNKAIEELVAEGFMAKIAEKYDMSESLAFK